MRNSIFASSPSVSSPGFLSAARRIKKQRLCRGGIGIPRQGGQPLTTSKGCGLGASDGVPFAGTAPPIQVAAKNA